MVGSVGDELPAILEGRTGSERHPDLAWSVGAYVCHINDNLRIWAERLVAFALGPPKIWLVMTTIGSPPPERMTAYPFRDRCGRWVTLSKSGRKQCMRPTRPGLCYPTQIVDPRPCLTWLVAMPMTSTTTVGTSGALWQPSLTTSPKSPRQAHGLLRRGP